MVMEIGTGAFQAGDIYAAMSQNQEARRKRNRLFASIQNLWYGRCGTKTWARRC